MPAAIRHRAAQYMIDGRIPSWRDAALVLAEFVNAPELPLYLRRQAAQSLTLAGRTHCRTAVDALANLCVNAEAHPHDRLEAALTVCDRSSDVRQAIRTLHALVQFLDASPNVRRRAAAALCKYDSTLLSEAAATLHDIHDDPSAPAEVRARAAVDLAEIGPSLLDDAVCLLGADLQHERLQVRVAAARNLAQLGNLHRDSAIRHLDRFAEELSDDSRAARWIRRIRRQTSRLSEVDQDSQDE
jgi:hypothetical protein